MAGTTGGTGGGQMGALRISLGLDSAQFTSSITELNRRIKGVRSEFDAVNDGTQAWARSLEGLRAKNDMLTRQTQLQSAKVAELRRQYEESVQAKGADARETQNLLTRYNRTVGALNRTEAQLRQVNDAIADQTNKAKKAERAMKDFGESAQNMGKGLTSTVTPALAGVATGLVVVADSAEASTSRIQRVLGSTREEAKKLSRTSRDLWKEGFGESLVEVEDGLLQVKRNMKAIDDQDLEKVTRNALRLSDVFDADMNEVTRAGNNLMKGFGDTSEEAFDLMAWGAQNGLDNSKELFDNLAEYSPLYKRMGFTSKEYFQLLAKGTESGAYNLDYLNDVMKEFQIRSKDGSKATADGMSQLSKSTQGTFKEFQNGKATVKDLHNAVIKDLAGMDDQTKANQIGVMLYGTKFEDLETDTMYALGGIDGKLKDVDGAMKRSGENVEKSFGEKAKIAFREVQDSLIPMGEKLLDIANRVLPKVQEAVAKAIGVWDKMSPQMQDMVIVFGGLAMIAPPIILGFGMMASAIGTLIPIVAGITGAIAGGTGLAGAIGLLTNPIGWSVIAIAGLTGGMIALDQAMDKPIIKSDIFKGKISEATEQAVGSYMKLSEEATAELNYLSSTSGIITDQMAQSMIDKYTAMNDTVLTAMKTRHSEELASLKKLFADSDLLTEEEEGKRMTKLLAQQAKEEEAHSASAKRIKEILDLAVKEKRDTTVAEDAEIARLRAEADKVAIENLSKTQAEHLLILNNMKEQKGILKAEETANWVKKSIEEKDKTIEQAEKKMNGTIKNAELQRDVTGAISAEEADTIIKNAKEESKGVIAKAKDTHSEVVYQARQQAGEHADEVDYEKGQVLSRWDSMYNGALKAWNWIRGIFGKEAKPSKGSVQETNNQKIKRQKATFAPAYAEGTKNGTHQGGLALVGEEGHELAHIPNRGITMLGVGGQEIVNLPKGSSVLPHKQTNDMLKKYNFPAYAGGVGDYFDLIMKGKDALWDKMKEKFNLSNDILPKWIAEANPLKMIGGYAKDSLSEMIANFMPSFGGGGAGFGAPFSRTSGFGKRNSPGGIGSTNHAGVDYGAPFGTPIPAQMGGKVVFSGVKGGYGNAVMIDSGGGYQQLYGHNSRNAVKVGQTISAGQIVGYVGSTGNSTGNHVHYEIRKNGKAINPDSFGGGNAKAGKGVQQWATLATRALQMTGQFSASNLQKMLHQMDTESSGNPKAINLWDSNARKGTPSKGLMQVIDPTFKKYAMKGYNSNIYDPLSNMLASIKYAVSRYGSLSKAYRGVGYEKGGIINEEHMAMVGEGGKREAIIPLERHRARALQLWEQAGIELGAFPTPQAMGAGSGAISNSNSEVNYNYTIQVAYTGNGSDNDIKDLARKLKEELQREEQQKSRAYGGR